MSKLLQRLRDSSRSGVYRASSAQTIQDATRGSGLDVVEIDAQRELFERMARALDFPDWFGGNWDALNDCLTDLEWLSTQSGYVLVFEDGSEFVIRHKSEFDNAKAVLSAAAKCWKTQGRPFWAFIEMPQSVRSGLPNWPAE